MLLKKFPFEYQLDAMDCGPACLKMICKYFGKYYSLPYLRDLCGITREGVSFLDLSYGAEKIGLHTLAVKADIQTLHEKVPLPCIVHWNNSHFIVVYKTTKQKIYVSDPAKGLISYDHEEFKKGWYKKGEETGAILAIEPIDHIKGLKYLTLSFKFLIEKLPHCSLVIVEDGNYDDLIKYCRSFSLNAVKRADKKFTSVKMAK